MLSYKGFIAEVDYDDNAEVFFGTVVNARPIMSIRDGVDPEKLFSGKITVRVPPGLHRRVAVKAATLKKSMNLHIENLMERDTLDIETVR